MVHRASIAVTGGIDRVRPNGAPATPGAAAPMTRDDGAFASLLTPDDTAGAGAQACASAQLSGAAWVQARMADLYARTAQDRQARRHGRAVLQALAGLQRAALRGDGDEAGAALASLADTVRDGHEADDPVLRLILREISVRAAVELARAASPAPSGPLP